MTRQQDRLCADIKRTLAFVLSQKIHNTKIGFISITQVMLSDDGKFAKVYYSQIGSGQDKQVTKKALESLKGVIKGELGRQMRIKIVPNLQFIFDPSLEVGTDVIQTLKDLDEKDA